MLNAPGSLAEEGRWLGWDRPEISIRRWRFSTREWYHQDLELIPD